MYAAMAFLGRLWAIFLLSFAIECLSLLWTPARDASLPNMVPRRQLANANSLGLVSTYATLPLGGAVFAVLTWLSAGVGNLVPFLGDRPETLALLLDAVHLRVLGVHGESHRVPAHRCAASRDASISARCGATSWTG